MDFSSSQAITTTRQSWFAPPGFPENLAGVWRQHWAYLQEQGVAPVLVGEFGGPSLGSDPEGVWQRSLISFLGQEGFSQSTPLTATNNNYLTPAGTLSNPYPTGFLQPACWINGTLVGNLRRNAGIKPTTVFTDLRIGKTFSLTEKFKLDGTVDMFNLINKFNVADVNVLWTNAGQATAAFDPRQFQFGLKLWF